MLRGGVTADTAGGVSGTGGEGEARPRKADELLRILVVDDNRDSADSLRLLLELFGHEVTVAYSGHDGVRAAEQCRPDVVLCDIGLPGLDGHGVARRLRGDPATAKARLIAVTAYGRDEDRRRSREAGFERHPGKRCAPTPCRGRCTAPPSRTTDRVASCHPHLTGGIQALAQAPGPFPGPDEFRGERVVQFSGRHLVPPA
jgi:CheY-like chemotaxis protein